VRAPERSRNLVAVVVKPNRLYPSHASRLVGGAVAEEGFASDLRKMHRCERGILSQTETNRGNECIVLTRFVSGELDEFRRATPAESPG
jgi:hypothetical protein